MTIQIYFRFHDIDPSIYLQISCGLYFRHYILQVQKCYFIMKLSVYEKFLSID